MGTKKYALKINYEFKEVIEKYLDKNPLFGYRSTSEFINELVRNEVKRILNENPELNRLIKVSKSRYVLLKASVDPDSPKNNKSSLIYLRDGVEIVRPIETDNDEKLTSKEFKKKHKEEIDRLWKEGESRNDKK